jgi:predicted nucleic acid-binding protein
MIYVIDANILFAAIIRDSATRKIILDSNAQFLAPDYLLTEHERYGTLLRAKSGLSEKAYERLLVLLLSRIRLVAWDELRMSAEQAYALAKDIDPYDTMFFACCLANPGSVLWSDDKKLKKQDKVKIVNTEEML